MKVRIFRFRDLGWCLAIVLLYGVFWQIMDRTRMVEKIMTMTFAWWEFLVVFGFVISRLLTYLLVPSILVAIGVDRLAHWALDRLRSSPSPQDH